MANINLLIFIHGVVEETIPSNHAAQYSALLGALRAARPDLANAIPDSQFIGLEWGHAPLPQTAPLLPDEQLTEAENTVLAATSYEVISSAPTADDTFLDVSPFNLERIAVRSAVKPIKETVFTLGISDAFYYATPDGEAAIRSHVYSEVLALMDNFQDADQLALHVVGHSLGATVGFDFLFGLLAPPSEYEDIGLQPGFIADNQGGDLDQTRFLKWRERAKQGRLVLGSKASFGSQVGPMMLRKQKLVNLMAAGQKLDPMVIGVPKTLPTPEAAPKWKVFYDTNDVLGYPARRLFDTVGTIKEYEVDSSSNPILAHTNYWKTGQVQNEIADLIFRNLI